MCDAFCSGIDLTWAGRERRDKHSFTEKRRSGGLDSLTEKPQHPGSPNVDCVHLKDGSRVIEWLLHTANKEAQLGG